MIEVTYNQRELLQPFFQDAYDSCCRSFLDGVQGRGFVNCIEQPSIAAIQLGDYCYLDGDASSYSARNHLSQLIAWSQNPKLHFVPLSASWLSMLQLDSRLRRVERYAIEKEDITIFNIEDLQARIQELGERYQCVPINEELFYEVQKEDWMSDFTDNFDSYETFLRCAAGYAILEEKEIVAGASSYSYYEGGIEVVIATRQDHRRQGLATIAGSALILACIERGLYPSWDATNRESVATAQKLGYHYAGNYSAFVLEGR